MKKQVGLWIDHRKAVIVKIEDEAVETQEIESNIEKHARFSSGTHSNASNNPQGPASEDSRDRQFEGHLDKYYEKIESIIHDADSIWIIGPGEAKIELENYLKSHAFCGCIAGVEPADKLTDKQIASKVRKYFQPKKS
jgi:hypothetical protein